MNPPDLVLSYRNFCRIKEECFKQKCIDLGKERWFFPTTLLPLGDLILDKKCTFTYNPPSDKYVSDYLKIMLDSPSTYPQIGSKTYVPMTKLSKEDPKKGADALYAIYPKNNNWTSYGGRDTYMMLIEELTDNVYEHSDFTTSMVMAQRYNKLGFVELCVFDNGISIRGSYKKKLNLELDGLTAIKEALKGVSTKGGFTRGYGLHTTYNIAVNGLKGEIMIVSSDGMLYHNFSEALGYNLNSDFLKLDGTLISIRFPIQKKEVDWRACIER